MISENPQIMVFGFLFLMWGITLLLLDRRRSQIKQWEEKQ
jgi:hypothetical protein